MICAIVLAAGQSKRMGAQKLLLPFAGKTVIEHIVDEVGAGPVDQIVVVLGADSEAVSAALSPRRLVFVHNPEVDSEMLASIRCGLAAVPAKCDAFLIVLGDQLGIRSQWIAELVSNFRAGGASGIVVPTHDGHRGHPILIAGKYREEILLRHDQAGIRGLLDAHADEVSKIPMDAGVLEDMDYPEDYRRELDRAR